MEMELGLKFTRIADEFTSDFQLAKDRAGPLFMSRETESMFILTAHLKGYKRRNIKIDINEDATLIAIGGEKQVKETVMVGWQVYKKGTETKAFKKAFKIPDGVILDKIKAKFNEDESTLTITMPKKVKGIRGTPIQEIKESQELVKEASSNLQIVDEKSPSSTIGTSSNQAINGEDDKQENTQNDQKVDDQENTQNDQKVDDQENSGNDQNKEISESEVPEISEGEVDMTENDNGVVDRTNDVSEEENVDEEKERTLAHVEEGEAGKVDKPREKRCKMCIPIVAAGSTLLVSLVVFVIQIVRSKNQSSRRRD